MFSLVLDLEFWGVYKNSIPYVVQDILTNGLDKGGLVNPDIFGFLDGPSEDPGKQRGLRSNINNVLKDFHPSMQSRIYGYKAV